MINMRKYTAELLGTFVLVFMGCGSAIFLGAATGVGHLAVALAFGLSIVAMAYVIGGISGCHINPVVSLSMLLSGKLNVADFAGYVIAQIIGAITAAGLLKALLLMSGVTDLTGGLGSNGFSDIGIGSAFIIEIILTFIFVLVILAVVSDQTKGNVAGIIIGLTLTFVHIVGIPLTGTSVNPARSIGPAVIMGGQPLAQLWVFILAPLVGAVLAAVVFKLLIKQAK